MIMRRAIGVVAVVAACTAIHLGACSRQDARTAADAQATAPASADRNSSADLDVGARIYAGSCVACHQENGKGLPGVYPSLAGSTVVLGDPRELARWIIQGVRPATMPAGRYSTAMPRFGWLKEPAAASLSTYLRTHFGNGGSPVDAATISAALGGR